MRLKKTFLSHNDQSYNLYYLGYYHPVNAGSDSFSHSLLKFKRGLQPDLDNCIRLTLEAFQEISLSRDTVILRALYHNETQVRPDTPLDRLSQAIADQFHCRYLPSLLHKTRPAQSNKILNQEERQNELRNIYRFTAKPPLTPHTPLLIIDDILTTGSTIRAIIDILPPSSIGIFTIALADNNFYPGETPPSSP
ncbi:MAG: hypothetical protein JST68_27430 [Bacteroidetes bacterium]|nr:hypothetical protein [Bacteroidota bacterium]